MGRKGILETLIFHNNFNSVKHEWKWHELNYEKCTEVGWYGIFYPKKVIQKSNPQISDVKNIIQKFYQKMFLSKMYATYSASLYIINFSTWC